MNEPILNDNKTNFYNGIVDVVLTELSSKNFLKNKDEHRCIQAFEIFNDAISKLYEVKLLLNSTNTLKENEIPKTLGELIQFKIVEQNKIEKYFSGIITVVQLQAFKNEKKFQYEITLRPYLWKLTQNNGYRSWIDKDTKEIIIILLNKKYKDIKYNFKLYKPELLKRKNTVQYGESDFDFLCRLLHEDGLNFAIDQTKEGQNLVITDVIEDYFEEKNKKSKPTIMQISTNLDKTYLNNHTSFFGFNHTFKLGTCTVKTSFSDARKYGESIESLSNIEKETSFHWESRPSLSKSSELINQLSSKWPNSEATRKSTMTNYVSVTERFRLIQVGEQLEFRFTENKANDGPLTPAKYYVANISHMYSRQDLVKNFLPSEDVKEFSDLNCNYIAKLTAYPKEEKIHYLETFHLPKNHIPFSITAKVFGKEKTDLKIEKKEAGILIGISFPWQTSEKKNDLECSEFIWARLAQFWASKNYGALFIPQPGDEVVINILENEVECLPVIVASLYNSINKPPLNLNEQKRGLIANEELEESIQLGIKTDDSSLIFNAKSLKTKIQQKTTIDLDEKSMTTNIKDKVKIVMNDAGSYELSSESFGVEGGSEIKMTADVAKINKLKVK